MLWEVQRLLGKLLQLIESQPAQRAASFSEPPVRVQSRLEVSGDDRRGQDGEGVATEGDPPMTIRATGPFDVRMNAQSEDKAAGSALGRLSLDKQFHGDLEGVGKGEMLTAMTDVKGSAAYVAIERVTGTLHGRRGSFVVVHRGIMAKGAQELALTIVPDSGTGDLAGLSGQMAINIVGGKHSYELDYTLPSAS